MDSSASFLILNKKTDIKTNFYILSYEQSFQDSKFLVKSTSNLEFTF